jgi:phage shock protein PspC (stress-responsive transcriptional regulator)
MNKVITIHLNGVAYQLEEQGFDALRAYLDTAGRRLEGNPDKDEILADIEQAIGDKFRSLLGVNKTVIITKEVTDIISEMGPVEDGSQSARPDTGAAAGSGGGPGAAASGGPIPTPKRLYKIREGAKVAGVCNGIAAYLDIDVTIVRVVFAVLAIGYGSGMLLYLLLMFILPEAMTPEEVAAAHGTPSATSQEFIRRARDGYYAGMRTFRDRKAHKEWKRKFKNDMRGWKRDFQREMHQSASQWRSSWNERWAPHAHPPGSWAAASFASLLLGLLSLACFCAIVSLVLTGGIFGFFLPGIPLWLGIILVIAVIRILKWPLRAVRGPYYYGHAYHCGPFGFLFTACLWIVVIYLILWMTGGHVASLHQAWQHLPPKLHHAADSVRQWWDQQ